MITWITGIPNTGKTTLAKGIQENHKNIIHLDIDILRPLFNQRNYVLFLINISKLALILSEQGHDVVISGYVWDKAKSAVTETCNPEWIEL